MAGYFDPAAFDTGPLGGAYGGVSYGPSTGFGGYFDPTVANAQQGILSGQPASPGAGGALSGQSSTMNSISPLLATMGGAMLAARGVGANAGPMVGAAMPQLAQDIRKRAAINNWLGAASQRGELDPQTLQVLQSDPELAQNLMAQRLTPHWQFQQTGVDAMGNPQYNFVNPVTQEIKGGTQGAGGGGAATGGAGAAGSTGGQVASTYDRLGIFPGAQQQVDSIIDGRAAPYTQRAASSPGMGRAVMQAVYEKDPTYDAGRYDTRQSFEHGKDADTVNAGQTAISHLDEVSAAAERLAPFASKSGLPFWDYFRNQVGNKAVMGSGSEEAQALNALETATKLYSSEKTKFYAGSGGGEGDREGGQAAFDAAKSPAEIQAGANQEVNLLQGKVSALQSKYHAAMGPNASDFPIIRPQDQKHIDNVRGRYAKAGGVVDVGSPAEAMKLPPGTRVRTPDGRIKIVPGGQPTPVAPGVTGANGQFTPGVPTGA